MAVSKGMPLLAGIAAIMVVSYTVFRLNYAANNLPYDPGDPYPAMKVAGSTTAELSSRSRDAILSRHSLQAREGTEALGVWPLRGLELERAIRYLDERIEDARSQPAETRTCLQLAMFVAARKLVDQDRAFVIESADPKTEVAGWHELTLQLFAAKDRARILYVPIDDREFGFVSAAATADPKTFDPR